jgi:hypothetical protein
MKTKMNNRWVFLILLLFCRCADSELPGEGTLFVSPGACFPEVSDKYTYPVLPGSDEWQPADDVFTLVQLPDDVLKTISTLGLIDALVNAPLFSGFASLSSTSSPVETWHRHYDRFNSARELFRRKDAGDALVVYYKSVCFDCLESFSGEERDRKRNRMLETISGLSLLFTKQEILDQIGHQKKRELVTDFLFKLKQMPDMRHTVFIPMAWVMLHDEYAPIVNYYRNNTELYEQYIAWGYVYSEEQADLIISFAKNFINNADNMYADDEYAVDLDCSQLPDTTGLNLYSFAPFTVEEMKTLANSVKLERRQIPESVLRGMTTKALFYQFVLCDLSPGMYMHNSAQAGFRATAKQLNMLPELLNRTDAGGVLLDLLGRMELATMDGLGCLHAYECMQRIIAQTEVIGNMTEKEIDEYIRLMMLHQKTIRELAETNDNWSYPESLAAILYGLGNVMLRYEYEPFSLLLATDAGVNGLMNGDNLRNEQTVSLINDCIANFSNR